MVFSGGRQRIELTTEILGFALGHSLSFAVFIEGHNFGLCTLIDSEHF